jgi:glutamine synthetase
LDCFVTLDDVLKQFEARGIRRVKLGATDIDGILRGKYVSIEKFKSAATGGIGFCDVVFGWDIADVLYDNAKYTGWHTGYPDAHATIDLSTLRYIPWEPGTAFFLLDFKTHDGSPLPIAPRQVMASVVEQAKQMGYQVNLGSEFEFWMFKETDQSLQQKGFQNLQPLSQGMFGYSVLRASQNADWVLALLDQLPQFNIAIEGFHTETGPGVYEAAINVQSGLEAADRSMLFKTSVKEISARHGLMPTFMAKWNADLPGSSGHIHQSLTDSTGKNVFYGEDNVMGHYIAGLVKYLPELMAMICPTINSYKRTVPGTWAPVNATWGEDSRTTAIRAFPGSAKSTRIELRLSGADMNAYLAMAASVAAGLAGIRERLEPPPATTNAYQATTAPPLPRTLSDATKLFHASPMARAAFGDFFVDHYTITREWEVRQFEKAVTNWELQRYFESI